MVCPYEEANKWMKKFAEKSYAKKGQEVVELNWKAIDAGTEGLREVKVDPKWIELDTKRVRETTGDEYFDSYVNVMGTLDGDTLPTSKFTEFELLDGTMKNDITFSEKRSIADRVPVWTYYGPGWIRVTHPCAGRHRQLQAIVMMPLDLHVLSL